MAHPLDSVAQGVESARGDLHALQAEIMEFLDANPYPVSYGRDPNTGCDVLKVNHIPVTPESDWSRRAGHIFGDARAVLDRIVFELATEAGIDPEKGHRAFPISDDSKKYFQPRGKAKISYRDACLDGIDDKWRIKVDELQPYNSAAPHNDPLWILNSLTNRHKHKQGIPVYPKIHTRTWSVLIQGQEDTGTIARPSGFEIYKLGHKLDFRVLGEFSTPRRTYNFLKVVEEPEAEGRDISITFCFRQSNMPLAKAHLMLDIVDQVIGVFKPAFEPPSV